MKKISYFVLLSMLVSMPLFVLAQSSGEGGAPLGGSSGSGGAPLPGGTSSSGGSINFQLKNPFSGGSDLMSIVNTLLVKVIDPIASVVVVVYIILAGFDYLKAQGNPGAIEKANQRLLYALIGAGILLGANAIALAVKATFGQFLQ